MKIGILTFHNAYNAGAVLQTFALQSFLSSLGHDVEVLDYRNKKIEERYKLFSFRSMPKRNPIRFVKYLLNRIYRKRMYYLFRCDVDKYLRISPKINNFLDIYKQEKDLIVIGSDQLWNNSLTGYNDPFYWAEFTQSGRTKAITYAICMNSDTISEEDVNYIRHNISNFSAISVRETPLADFLSNLTEMDIHVSLDPTLMINRNVWTRMPIIDKKPTSQKYVCVYAILERAKVIDEARKLASSNGFQLIVMEPIADVSLFNNRYNPATLLGFISAIANAEYVVTSSFHGLAFSIIFHKEVFVFGDSGKNERMRSLLDKLGIMDHFVVSGIYPRHRIDYQEVERILNVQRNDSQNYLINAINEINIR